MEAQTPIRASEPSTRERVARRLLTLERLMMGVVFIGCGVAGILNMAHGVDASAAAMGGSLMKMGFLFPLLKGSEVLLELYLSSTGRKP